MAQTNSSRANPTDALMNTLRRSMYRQGIVGSAMQTYYDNLHSQQTSDSLEEQNEELRKNNLSLRSLEKIASNISANVFSIANLLQKQYNLAVRARMMREREKFRRESLAEEAIFEAPRYSATVEETERTKTASKKSPLADKARTGLILAQIGALVATAIPQKVSELIQQAEKQIDEFTISAKNFLSDLIDGYVEEDNVEAKARSAEDKKEDEENETEDLETDRLLTEIETEYDLQDKELDSTIEAGSDLTENDSEDQEEDSTPPRPVEQPPVSMGETGMDLPVVSETTLSPNYAETSSVKPTPEPSGMDLPVTNIEPYESPPRPEPIKPTLTSSIPASPEMSPTSGENIKTTTTPNVSPERTAIQTSQETSTPTQSMPNTPMAEALPKPQITSELNPYASSVPQSNQPITNESIPNIAPRSYLPNTPITTSFNPADATPPRPVTIGSVIGEITATNRTMAMSPMVSSPSVVISNQNKSQVAPQSPEFIVPSPIANRGALEIGIHFNAGR